MNQKERAGAHVWPFLVCKIVRPTDTAKVEAWDEWLAARKLPPLAQLAVLVIRDSQGLGYRLPLNFPPIAEREEDREIERRFLTWLGHASLLGSTGGAGLCV